MGETQIKIGILNFQFTYIQWKKYTIIKLLTIKVRILIIISHNKKISLIKAPFANIPQLLLLHALHGGLGVRFWIFRKESTPASDTQDTSLYDLYIAKRQPLQVSRTWHCVFEGERCCFKLRYHQCFSVPLTWMCVHDVDRCHFDDTHSHGARVLEPEIMNYGTRDLCIFVVKISKLNVLQRGIGN